MPSLADISSAAALSRCLLCSAPALPPYPEQRRGGIARGAPQKGPGRDGPEYVNSRYLIPASFVPRATTLATTPAPRSLPPSAACAPACAPRPAPPCLAPPGPAVDGMSSSSHLLALHSETLMLPRHIKRTLSRAGGIGASPRLTPAPRPQALGPRRCLTRAMHAGFRWAKSSPFRSTFIHCKLLGSSQQPAMYISWSVLKQGACKKIDNYKGLCLVAMAMIA